RYRVPQGRQGRQEMVRKVGQRRGMGQRVVRQLRGRSNPIHPTGRLCFAQEEVLRPHGLQLDDRAALQGGSALRYAIGEALNELFQIEELVRLRHLRIEGHLVLEAALRAMEGTLHVKNRLTTLSRYHPSSREATAVTGELDVVNDRQVARPRQQEVAVQRMRSARWINGDSGCFQALTQYLPAE